MNKEKWKVKDVVEQIEAWVPTQWAEDWDNVGLLVGDYSRPVKKILIALDISYDVVLEAVTGKYDFIISHHPLIYNPIKSITSADPTGRKILTLMEYGINVYCAHTNLDKAPGGVNDCLFEILGLENPVVLIEESDGLGLGRVGNLPHPMTREELALHIKKSLNLPNIRYAGNSTNSINKVGICGGDASSTRFIQAAHAKGCDAFITGDLRYHGVQEAVEMGLNMYDITHYSGEAVVLSTIESRLRKAAEEFGVELHIQATSTNGQVFVTM